jgi:hypothetical protein
MNQPDPITVEIIDVAEQIRPFLAGRPPEIQGAILAELLSVWIAGHYPGGQQLMDAVLETHLRLVRQMIPTNVEMLISQGRMQRRGH